LLVSERIKIKRTKQIGVVYFLCSLIKINTLCFDQCDVNVMLGIREICVICVLDMPRKALLGVS
jgi:hypothetical protein